MALMNAMVLREHGGPEVLHLEQLPIPEPDAGEVRVQIKAVALNHLDIWARRGGPAFKLTYPHRLGSDIAGIIDAVGAGGKAVVGTKVVVQPGLSCGRCASCLGGHDNLCRFYSILGEHAQGGYAEYIVVPEVNLAPYPEMLDFAHAAAGILPFLTAWQMVVHKARVQPGDAVLVQGAGSGIGVAAIQIAKLYGARVIATAGSDEKGGRAMELGADHVVNYATQDFVAEAKRLTDKRGVDLVIEHVGGDVMAKSVLATALGGRIVTCGTTAGFEPKIDFRHVFFRQIEILGSTMGPKGSLFRILEHVRLGKLKPVVDRVLPLWDAREAHRALEAREAFGKIVLEVD
jgi:NADPH:quinone reductase-like Zn-dependent oxidoreductase